MANIPNDVIIQALDKAISHRIHFFCYRLPGEQQLHFGAQIIEQHTPVGFYVHPFCEDINTPVSYISAQFDAVKFLKVPLSSLPRTNCRLVMAETTSKETYMAQAARCISDLKGGKFKKIVLSRTICNEYAIISWRNVFKNLLDKNPDAFVFAFHSEEAGFWMGASPEKYLSYHRDQVSTMALAGTRMAGSADEWSDKEREEQKIVADYICEKFDLVGMKYAMSPTYTRNAGTVEHICNDFEGTVTTPTQVDKLRNFLHPTPAIAGVPAKEAIKYIKDVEKRSRRYYGGFIGPVDAWGNFDFYVNLRSLEFDSERYCIYVGGGLTADSDPEKEWQETIHKAKTLQRFL